MLGRVYDRLGIAGSASNKAVAACQMLKQHDAAVATALAAESAAESGIVHFVDPYDTRIHRPATVPGQQSGEARDLIVAYPARLGGNKKEAGVGHDASGREPRSWHTLDECDRRPRLPSPRPR